MLPFVPVLLLILARSGDLAEGDPFWQIRAGKEVLSGGGITPRDTWSWVVQGEVWTPNSWGWNVVLALAYKAGGLIGVGILSIVLLSTLYYLLARRSLQEGAETKATGAALLLGGLLLLPWMSVRAQLATYILTLLLIMLLPACLDQRRRWALPLVFTLQAVAVNLHLGAASTTVLYAGALTAFLIHKHGKNVLSRESTGLARDTLKAASAGTAVALGSLTSPLGPGLLTHASGVKENSEAIITEWMPSYQFWDGSIMLALGAVGIVWAWRRGRTLEAGALAAALILSLDAYRFTAFIMLLFIPELAVKLSGKRLQKIVQKRPEPVILLSFLVVVFLAPGAYKGATSPGTPNPAKFNAAAAEALPEGCRVYNTFTQAGLILLLRPDVQVSMDGRNDLYGEERVVEQLRVGEDAPGADEWLEENEVTCTLTGPPVKEPDDIIDRLEEDPRWEKTYDDGARRVLVRVKN